MTERIRSGDASRQYGHRAPVRYRQVDAVEAALARLLGARSHGAAHARLLRARGVIRAYARACVETGATVRLSSLLAELAEAREGARRVDGQLTVEEWQDAHAADALEDTARIDLHLAPSAAAEERLERALVREIDEKLHLVAELRARRRGRRGGNP